MSEEHVCVWRFDGDDPYVVCACGVRRDALTGRLIEPIKPVPHIQPDPQPTPGNSTILVDEAWFRWAMEHL